VRGQPGDIRASAGRHGTAHKRIGTARRAPAQCGRMARGERARQQRNRRNCPRAAANHGAQRRARNGRTQAAAPSVGAVGRPRTTETVILTKGSVAVSLFRALPGTASPAAEAQNLPQAA